MASNLKAGDAAPNFTLKDQNGSDHTLLQYRGQWVLIYFYPRDNTPGCTTEARAIRDRFDEFNKQEINVFGISTDSVKKHANFAGKYNLPFALLADENQVVVNLYGVWGMKKFMGREFMGTNRMSFLINPEGKVVKIYEKVKPAEHANEVLADHKVLK